MKTVGAKVSMKQAATAAKISMKKVPAAMKKVVAEELSSEESTAAPESGRVSETSNSKATETEETVAKTAMKKEVSPKKSMKKESPKKSMKKAVKSSEKSAKTTPKVNPNARFSRRHVESTEEQMGFYYHYRPALARGRKMDASIAEAAKNDGKPVHEEKEISTSSKKDATGGSKRSSTVSAASASSSSESAPEEAKQHPFSRDLIQPYVDTAKNLYWGPSTLGGNKVGNGVFTKIDVIQGDIVEIAPLIIDADKNWKAQVTEKSEWNPNPKSKVQYAKHDYYTITYDPLPDEVKDALPKKQRPVPRSALMLGYGSLYNHSEKPNVAVEWGALETVLFRATRDILAHEELFISYGDDYWQTD